MEENTKPSAPTEPDTSKDPSFEVKHSSALGDDVPKAVKERVVNSTSRKNPRQETAVSRQPSKPRLDTKRRATVYLPSDEDEEEELFEVEEDPEDDEEEDIDLQDEETDYFEEPEPKHAPPRDGPKPINTKKEWREFMKFVDKKKLQPHQPQRSKNLGELKRIEENMEIVRRIANVKYKPKELLTMDDYLAWYSVEEGKVSIPGPLMDLIRPDYVRVSPSASQSSVDHRPEIRRKSGTHGLSSPGSGIPAVPSEPQITTNPLIQPLSTEPSSQTLWRRPTPGMFSLGRLF